MFGFRLSVKCVAGAVLAGSMAIGAVALQAQPTHQTRRESSANRKARAQRMIAETYGHRYEVAGGGGYLRFDSGAPQRNNEVTFFMTGTYFLNPKLGILGDIRGAYGSAKVGNTPCTINGCSPIFLGFNPQILGVPHPWRRRLPAGRQREVRCHRHGRSRNRHRQVRWRSQRLNLR